MNWYSLSQQELNKEIKNIILHDEFMLKMLKDNAIPEDKVENCLEFSIKNLDGKKGKSDSKSIIFDKNIFNENFEKTGLHFLVHELYHWISRQRERNFYFADPEEVEAFTLGITYELLRKTPLEKIIETYYPIIEEHFDEKTDACKLFRALLTNATKKVKQYHELA